MKSLILLILVVGSFFNVAGCMKAKRNYQDFENYHNSLGGVVSDFATGYEAGSRGDPFGPVLDFNNQERELASAKSSRLFWAWVWVGATFVAFQMAGRKAPGK